jgi:N-acetylglucosamine-6-phosphate deacetylase
MIADSSRERGVTHVIHSARLVSGGTQTPDAWVAFSGDTVSALGTGTSWSDLGVVADAVTDAAGRWLTPGFIDIHCHGGGGASFDDGAEPMATAIALHQRHGTTRIVISLVSAGGSETWARLATVATETERNPLVLGAHLEGPFLNHTFRGAHDGALLREADADSVARLLAAGRGSIRQVTIAPELPGSTAAIAALLAAGVKVAVGHTAADFTTTLAAFTSGASILTHAFNAMHGIHHREPGPVIAAIRSTDVILEIINDGTHVHPEIVRLAFDEAPGRIALVTDAMAAAGASAGRYVLGTLPVTVTDGVARLDDGGAIAGSTLTMDEALRRTVIDSGVAIEDAVTAATSTPARAIGREHDLGQLAVGFAADAVLLDEDLKVDVVFAAGRRLH